MIFHCIKHTQALVGGRVWERDREGESLCVCVRQRERRRDRWRGEVASRSSIMEDADDKCDSNYCRRLTLLHPRVCSLTPDVRARFGL